MFKKYIFTYIALSFTICGTLSTSHKTIYNIPKIDTQKTVGITLYSEETKWYYRIVNGKLQKRLWSLTYKKWLTNWIWV